MVVNNSCRSCKLETSLKNNLDIMVVIRDLVLTLLWEHLKYTVYIIRPKSIDELKQKITIECVNMSPAALKRVAISLRKRIQKCISNIILTY